MLHPMQEGRCRKKAAGMEHAQLPLVAWLRCAALHKQGTAMRGSMQAEEQRPLRAELQAPEGSRSVEQDGTIHIEGSQHSQAELEQPQAAPPRAPPLPPPLLPRRPQQPVRDDRGRTTLVINLASIMERVDE